MKIIEMMIECPSCKGTGVYVGMGESRGTAVVCTACKGTGESKYHYEYNEFTGKKLRDDIERVYLGGYGYKIGLGKLTFKCHTEIEIDMDKEGVSYTEFFEGKNPEHIEKLACPMMADQGSCHKIEGFVDKCEKLNGGWINLLSRCKHNPCKAECWDRFKKA